MFFLAVLSFAMRFMPVSPWLEAQNTALGSFKVLPDSGVYRLPNSGKVLPYLIMLISIVLLTLVMYPTKPTSSGFIILWENFVTNLTPNLAPSASGSTVCYNNLLC